MEKWQQDLVLSIILGIPSSLPISLDKKLCFTVILIMLYIYIFPNCYFCNAA